MVLRLVLIAVVVLVVGCGSDDGGGEIDINEEVSQVSALEWVGTSVHGEGSDGRPISMKGVSLGSEKGVAVLFVGCGMEMIMVRWSDVVFVGVGESVDTQETFISRERYGRVSWQHQWYGMEGGRGLVRDVLSVETEGSNPQFVRRLAESKRLHLFQLGHEAVWISADLRDKYSNVCG